MAPRLFAVILLCLAFSWSSPVIANGDSSEPVELVELEELDEIETGDVQDTGLKSILGNLHPAVVHFPIAWLALLTLFELIGLANSSSSWHRVGSCLLYLTTISFIPAVITGLLQSDMTALPGHYLEILVNHRNLNFISAGLCVTAIIFRWRLRTDQNRLHRMLYIFLILGATGITLYSGHLGGKLVHG